MKRTLAITGLSLLSALAWGQMGNFTNKPTPPFIHPEGYYAMWFPKGWSHRMDQDGNMVAKGVPMDNCELTVTLRKVPSGADTELVALNASRVYRKLPHFKDGGGGRLSIDDKPASIRSYEFDYHGNKAMRVAVEELYVTSGPVLFTLHFEVFTRSFSPELRQDLLAIYDAIRIAQVDASGQPVEPAAPMKTKAPPHTPGLKGLAEEQF